MTLKPPRNPRNINKHLAYATNLAKVSSCQQETGSEVAGGSVAMWRNARPSPSSRSGNRTSAHGVRTSMELDAALDFVRDRNRGVLTTLKRDGRPQLSNIVYAVGDDGRVRISVTDDRAKTANLRRDPRASLHVSRDDFWAYVVLEGTAELSAVSTEPGDEVGRELADVYRAVAGEHDDWDDYYRAQVDQRRLVVRLQPERAYGLLGR